MTTHRESTASLARFVMVVLLTVVEFAASLPASADQPNPTSPLGNDTIAPPEGAPRLPTLEHPTTARARAAVNSGTFVYDIAVIALDIPAGPSPATATNSIDVVNVLDREFRRETQGMYGFRLREFLRGSTSANPPDVTEALAASPAWPTTPSAGAVGVIPVVVTSFSPPAGYGGQAYVGHAGMHINGYWDPTSGSYMHVFGHETGHNLGLMHASSVSARSDATPWPAGTSPAVTEYGDTYDTMGSARTLGAGFDLRFSGYELHRLGVHDDGSVAVVGAGGQTRITLSPKYASQGSRTVYLPWRDRGKFTIEYRPATGIDAGLAGGCFPWGCSSGVGAGVLVRMSNLAGDLGPTPYDGGTWSGSFLLPRLDTSGGGAWRPGDSLVLPDGSNIVVESADDAQATVLITRPADASAPQLDARILGDCEFGTSCDRTTRKATQGFALEVYARDDFWTQEVGVRVVGTGGDRSTARTFSLNAGFDSHDPDRSIAQEIDLPTGEWQLQAYAIDSSGNRTESGTAIVRVERRTSATAIRGFSRRTVRAEPGDLVQDRIRIRPGSNRAVLLQRRRPGQTWRTSTTLTADSRGRVLLTMRVGRGTWEWRVKVPHSAELGAQLAQTRSRMIIGVRGR